jgi:hemerythrin
MPLLEWSEELSCNVKEIDDQHRRLVGMINELHQAMLQGQTQAVLAGTISKLEDYAIYHFATEERYMALYHYPGAQAHIAEHGVFMLKVADFQKKYEATEFGLSIQIFKYLSAWLRDHIMVSDKAFGPFFNANGLCGYGAPQT